MWGLLAPLAQALGFARLSLALLALHCSEAWGHGLPQPLEHHVLQSHRVGLRSLLLLQQALGFLLLAVARLLGRLEGLEGYLLLLLYW